jgi:hypothetical protein
MSCAITIDAVRERRKTVTRRHVDTWQTLKPGDRLTLVEKAMGLRKGERHVVLAEVEVVSNEVVGLLGSLNADEIAREGFNPHDYSLPVGEIMVVDAAAWAQWWADAHGFRYDIRRIWCRRIEWRYLDDEVAS